MVSFCFAFSFRLLWVSARRRCIEHMKLKNDSIYICAVCTRTSNKLKLFRRVCDLLSTALAMMIKLREKFFRNYIKTQGGNNNMMKVLQRSRKNRIQYLFVVWMTVLIGFLRYNPRFANVYDEGSCGFYGKTWSTTLCGRWWMRCWAKINFNLLMMIMASSVEATIMIVVSWILLH